MAWQGEVGPYSAAEIAEMREWVADRKRFYLSVSYVMELRRWLDTMDRERARTKEAEEYAAGWEQHCKDAERRAETAELQRDEALDWTHDDKPLPEDDEIHACGPWSGDNRRNDLYTEAMRLVGAKRSKGALVELVNWLLHRIEVVEAKRVKARAHAERLAGVLRDTESYLRGRANRVTDFDGDHDAADRISAALRDDCSTPDETKGGGDV